MNRKLTNFICLIVLLILTISSIQAAPSSRVEGYVLDGLTTDALPGANVFIEGTNYGAATDLQGKYVIHNVPAGTYTLTINYIGYLQKKIEITVEDGKPLKANVALDFEALEGETIEVTAQAEGQMQAINQQLSSDKIVNIVSESRIQELPDFNAAQAVARLPGVSTLESSGEANKVVIRGLAPQYNQITVGGVQLASTGSAQIGVSSQGGTSGFVNNDRSTDLSMITPYMIKSIAVYKALTPDFNANSLGGTVNMELREAPSDLHVDLLAQGGYTQKSNEYGNYRFVGSASTRFFDDNLGVYLLANAERYDRNADNMTGSYVISQNATGDNGYYPVKVSGLSLQRHIETRERFGGNLILDYRLPAGSVKLINMFSRLNSNYNDYRTSYQYNTGDLDFRYRAGENNVDVALTSLDLAYDFGLMSVNVKAANNYSRNQLPDAPDFLLRQTRGVGNATDNTLPEDLTYLQNYNPNGVYLQTLALYKSDYKENGQTLRADFKFPMNFVSTYSGYIKFGSEYLHRLHNNSQNTPYADIRGGGGIPDAIIAGIMNRYPDLIYDPVNIRFPASNFTGTDPDLYEPFLDDKFGSMLWIVDPDILTDITHYIANNPQFSGDSATAVQPGGWFNGYFQKLPNTYTYDENLFAAYLMAEINIGDFMAVGGVRYEEERSYYDAYNLKDGRDTKSQTYYEVQAQPKNKFWLPMVQGKYNVTDWFDIRYAYTQTLARPDFHQLSPHFTITYSRNSVYAGNPNLRPAQSFNHDAIFTFHSSKLGLLSVGGFYKTIKDFTYSTQYALFPSASGGLDSLSSYNIGGVTPLQGAILYTFLNTPYDSHVKGIEFEFQTRLWYLPDPLNGLLLGVNYAHMESEATYPLRDNRTDYTVRPPKTTVFDSTRTGRLVRQPNDVMNAYIGYDYKGFSARLSFVFQGNAVSYHGNFGEQDGFTRDYFRMDASVKQILPWNGFEVFMDLNNINGETNRSAQISIGGFTNEQNYGFVGSFGVRYRM